MKYLCLQSYHVAQYLTQVKDTAIVREFSLIKLTFGVYLNGMWL